MYQLTGKRILLGVTGGIAAYKSAVLLRLLRKQGVDVRVVMTQGATEFVTPLTFQALSGKPVHTELLDVVWQVGKSGVVSPVAILDPVEVEGAIVGRATLHNIEYIRSLELEIGCTVEVIRSGEIIPRILRRVDQKKNSS